MLLGADVREDLGHVADHVDGTVFLSHLKMRATTQLSSGTELVCRRRQRTVPTDDP